MASEDQSPAEPTPLLAKLLAERAEQRRMAPLMRELDERRMRALVTDYRDELEGGDATWLAALGATIERSDNGFVMHVAGHACAVEAGVGASILIDGMPFAPEPQFYTTKTYHQFRDRLEAWARASGRL